MPFHFLFEQFHVLGLIHSGVGRNEMHASSGTARHGTPNNLAWWVFHCGYNIFLVKSLTQWSSKVHMERFKLLHGAFIGKQHILPQSETSSIVQSLFITGVKSCRHMGLQSKHYLLSRLEAVLEFIALLFKCKIPRIFLQELFSEDIALCLVEWSSLDVVVRGLPDLFLR